MHFELSQNRPSSPVLTSELNLHGIFLYTDGCESRVHVSVVYHVLTTSLLLGTKFDTSGAGPRQSLLMGGYIHAVGTRTVTGSSPAHFSVPPRWFRSPALGFLELRAFDHEEFPRFQTYSRNFSTTVSLSRTWRIPCKPVLFATFCRAQAVGKLGDHPKNTA